MEHTISTTGLGSASAVPDTARLDVTVGATGEAVPQALAAVASGVAALGEVVRGRSDGAEVRSTGLSLWPRTDDQGGSRGYEVRHSLSVTCPGLDAAGDLLDALGHELGGLLRVDGVQPVVGDPAVLEREARALAWADAAAKAEEIAGLAGLAVGPPLSVSEGGGGVGTPRVAPAAMAAKTRFEPGTASVTASLAVTWSASPA